MAMRCTTVSGRVSADGRVEWRACLEDADGQVDAVWLLPAGSGCPIQLGGEYVARVTPVAAWPPPPPKEA
ncbi:MAG: hypothetical protein AB7G37_03485 [Solirubrobacteraceae bacterium]